MTTTEPVTSWDLVTAAQAGDTAAFGQLWQRYRLEVAHYIASRVRNRHTTEDLTSETFLRAWKGISTVRDQGVNVGAWFNRIAKNVTIDHSRRVHNTHSAPVADLDVLNILPPTAGPDVTVPDQRGTAATSERLDWLIQRLSQPQQDVIRSRFYAGLSIAETAVRLGCSEPAVKAVQHRAVRNLELSCRPSRTIAEFTAAMFDGPTR